MTEDELQAIEAQASTWREDVEAHFRALVAEVRRLTRESRDANLEVGNQMALRDEARAERDAALAKLAAEAANNFGVLDRAMKAEAKLAEVTRERDMKAALAETFATERDSARQHEAASRAREAELRAALEAFGRLPLGSAAEGNSGEHWSAVVAAHDGAVHALARPDDRSALDAAIAEAREDEREKERTAFKAVLYDDATPRPDWLTDGLDEFTGRVWNEARETFINELRLGSWKAHDAKVAAEARKALMADEQCENCENDLARTDPEGETSAIDTAVEGYEFRRLAKETKR